MEQADDEQAEDQIQQIHLCLSHLSPLTSLLQAIKIGAKQVPPELLLLCKPRSFSKGLTSVHAAGMQRDNRTRWALAEVGG